MVVVMFYAWLWLCEVVHGCGYVLCMVVAMSSNAGLWLCFMHGCGYVK